MTAQADLEVLQRLLEARHSCRAYLPAFRTARAPVDQVVTWMTS